MEINSLESDHRSSPSNERLYLTSSRFIHRASGSFNLAINANMFTSWFFEMKATHACFMIFLCVFWTLPRREIIQSVWWREKTKATGLCRIVLNCHPWHLVTNRWANGISTLIANIWNKFWEKDQRAALRHTGVQYELPDIMGLLPRFCTEVKSKNR